MAGADEEQRRQWAITCAHGLGLGGIALTVNQELVWFSDQTSARLEDLQFLLGQGPALHGEDPAGALQIPDISQLLVQQWPQFAAEAEALGVVALFVWPVSIGAAQVGTLTGYRRTIGSLTSQQFTEGWLVADHLAEEVLARWPGASGPSNGAGTVGAVELHRAELHQATGVLSHRQGVPLPEALDRLRARAYASGQSLAQTARDVIAQELPQDFP
ncbi:ANTAR domain-containing protein [Streptomyces sp. NPDC051214]|uniref:ANTAR domain-containing protein n=1 Tax=Streptomyces sp. NPDC051214 TaxID=3155282 RepID=UPI003442F397